MIKTEILLFSTGKENDKNIWYWDNNPICAICGRSLDFEAVFIVDWDKKKGRIDNLIHHSCIKNFVKSPLSVTQYRWNVLLTNTIPQNSTPIFIPTPSFSPTKNTVSVFEVDKIISDKTIDNAWRSKKYPSIEGASIGDQAALENNLNKDREIEKDPIGFLKEQKELSKKAVLESKKIKMIEEESKK